jgi:hypothetical protein
MMKNTDQVFFKLGSEVNLPFHCDLVKADSEDKDFESTDLATTGLKTTINLV